MNGPDDQPPTGQDHHEREHFFGAAKLIAALTMLSRVLGLVRDIAIVAFGATRMMDSFWTAFRVPNVFRRLFGEGALSAAFIPVFTQVAEAEGWGRARLLLANCMGLLGLILAAVAVLIELGLLAALLLVPGGWDRQLLLKLTMAMLPFMFTVCLLALGSAALQCKGRFAYPAAAPILLNVFLIAAAALAHLTPWGAARAGLFLLAGAVVAAGVVQLVGVYWLLKRAGLSFVPRIAPVLPEARRIAAMTLPMLVPLGIAQISSLFDSLYAWIMSATEASPTLELFGATIQKPLTEGVVTCLYAAERLYNFPLGILAISLATAVFPLLARYAGRGDKAGLAEATNRALRLSLFLGIPAGVALMLLARPAVALIYGHGRFGDNPEDIDRAAAILQMYSLGMWAYFSRHILLRAFFSISDAATPLKISCWLAGVNMLLVAGLVFTPLRARAIGLATAATAAANVLVLSWILHRRWGRLGLRRIGSSAWRTLLATAVMAAAVVSVLTYLGPAASRIAEGWGRAWIGHGIVVVVAILAGSAAFLAVAAATGCQELAELLGSLTGRQKTDSDGPRLPRQ